MIKVMSRILFWKFLENQNINDLNVETLSNTFFISINSTEGNDSVPYFKQKHWNTLTLFFDDCDEYKKYSVIGSPNDYYEQIPMSNEQSLELINFIEKMDENSQVYVHCTAGVSRSGAVGAFINDYFSGNWEKFKFDNPHIIPNSHISSLLKRTYYGKYPEVYK